MLSKFPDVRMWSFIESGGDNLAATFSPDAVGPDDLRDRCGSGEKIPRKGGPGITKSDLLIINKTDLAPYVGANLEVMESDTRKMRGDRPFVMCNLRAQGGLDVVIRSIERQGMLSASASA